MHEGGDYWAGQTNRDSDGNIVNSNWRVRNLFYAIGGNDQSRIYFDFSCFCIRNDGAVGYNDASSIIEAIDVGYITALRVDEWFALLALAGGSRVRGCQVARAKGRPNANDAIDSFCSNVPEVSMPKENLILSILSFLLLYYYRNREEFSNFFRLKASYI